MLYLGTSPVANGKVNLQGLGAFALTLVPDSANAGGFPVSARFDGANGDPHRVEKVEELRPGTLFNSAIVDVSPGGGRDGDKWHVFVDRLEEASSTWRPRTNAQGILRTVPVGAQVLFDINSRDDMSPFGPLLAFNGDAFITPTARRAFTKLTGEPPGGWDVSEFDHVLYVVEQIVNDAFGGLDWSFKPYVLPGATPAGWFHDTLYMGSSAEFGKNAGTPWALQMGSIILGAAADEEDTHSASVAQAWPSVRFGLKFADNTDTFLRLTQGNVSLRIAAVAW